jgi:hypothetical protein
MRRALALLVVPAAVLALAACGGGEEPSVEPGEAVAAAATNTAEAGSSKIAFTATFGVPTGAEGEVTEGALSGEGEFDYENRRGRLTVDLGDLLSEAGLPGDASFELLLDGTVLYVNFPLLTAFVPDAKEWLKVDLEQAAGIGGLDLSQLGGNDPTRYLEYLQATGAEVEEIGSEEVRGVETTHYSATVDLEEALELVPEDQRASVQALIDAGTTALPLDTWVDGDGLVRRIDVEVPAGESGGTGNVTMDLFEFGLDVEIEPPPADQVTDVSELEGLAGVETATAATTSP